MIAPVFLLAGLAGFAIAQTNSTSYTPLYTVDPGSVDIATKQGWCTSQTNTCLEICSKETNSNACTATDLSWSCVCTNFATPNISSFTGTVPYFECTQYVANCQTYNTNNVLIQQGCLKIDCAPNNPANFVAAASSASSSSSSSSSSSAASSVSTVAVVVTSASSVLVSTTSSSTVTVATTIGGSATTTSGAVASASSVAASAASTVAAATTAGAALAWPTVYGSGLLGVGAAVLAGMAL